MERADDSTREEDGRREKRRLGCGANLDQLETREEEADHNRGKHFEEAFNPEVNHPPAPVFGSDKVTALTIHQSRGIEERDGNAGDEEQDQKRAVFALANERRLQSRDHQDQPKNQADEQQDLPESSKIDIFISLAAEPEPHVARGAAGYRATHRQAIRQPRESVRRRAH